MQISDEIIKVLEYLCGKIGLTIDWTSSNVLPYVKQLCEKYIKWEIATSIVWIVIFVAAIIMAYIFSKKVHLCEEFEKFIFWVIAASMVAMIGIQVFDIVECCTFPEKAIYEYIQDYLSMHGS